MEMTLKETIQENIEYNNFEESNDEIICPYCGYKEEVSYEMYWGDEIVDEYKAGEIKLKCPKCEHDFLLTKDFLWVYTTEIIKER